jgi:hypothetical protein
MFLREARITRQINLVGPATQTSRAMKALSPFGVWSM